MGGAGGVCAGRWGGSHLTARQLSCFLRRESLLLVGRRLLGDNLEQLGVGRCHRRAGNARSLGGLDGGLQLGSVGRLEEAALWILWFLTSRKLGVGVKLETPPQSPTTAP